MGVNDVISERPIRTISRRTPPVGEGGLGGKSLAVARAVLRFALRPAVFVTLALAAFTAFSVTRIRANAESAAGQKTFTEGDTGHYLDIARTFAAGDFSMSYVQARPHRQPLYPLLLAPVFRWGGGQLAALAAVNVALTGLTFLGIYLGLRHRLRSRAIAAIAGGLFLLNPFVVAQATQHLLTEPLHLLLAVGVIFAVWDYLVSRRGASLVGAFALAGLDYLARPNGLFLAAAMAAVVGIEGAARVLRGASGGNTTDWKRGLALAAAAGGAFVVVSSPSWVPRLVDYGNPIYHGYLSNYLWVDRYAEGHVGQRFAKYSARDYFATHGADDVAQRWVRGLWQCGAAIPVRIEGRVPALFLLGIAGAGWVLWRGRRDTRALLLFAALQMLPLVWTNLSNPTVRVPYAALLPFEVVFAAVGVRALQVGARRSDLAAALRRARSGHARRASQDRPSSPSRREHSPGDDPRTRARK